MTSFRSWSAGLAAVFGLLLPARAQELPRPSYANATIIGIEHSVWDSTELASIKAGFDFGLYAWLSMSYNHLAPSLAWRSDWTQASQNMSSQKSLIDSMIARAKAEKVAIHIVLCSGLARNLGVYAEAKQEDVPVGHEIVPAFHSQEAGLLDPRGGAQLVQGGERHHLRPDKTLFHIGMDLPRGPGGRGAGGDVPGPHLGADDGIKGHQTQQPEGFPHQPRHAGFGKTQPGQKFLALLGGEGLEFSFQVPQDGHHRPPARRGQRL